MCSLWFLCLLFAISSSRPASHNPVRGVIEIIVKSEIGIIKVGVQEEEKDEEVGEEEEERRTGAGRDVDVLKELEQLEIELELDGPVSGAEYDGQEAVQSFFESYDDITDDIADGLRLVPVNLVAQAEETVEEEEREEEREGMDGAEEFLELIVIPKRQHVRYDKPTKEDHGDLKKNQHHGDLKKNQHTTYYEIPGVNIIVREGSTGEIKGSGVNSYIV